MSADTREEEQAATEVLALYMNLDERKVTEFEKDKIKIMDNFIDKNKNDFDNKNLRFSSKLKKWK